jgi:hypothetical protein
LFHFVEHRGCGESSRYERAACGAEANSETFVGEQRSYGIGEGLRIFRRHQ